MSQIRQSRTFRVSEIPESWSRSDLDHVLEEHGIAPFPSEYRLQPSPFGTRDQTAILSLDPTAKVLQGALKNPLSNCLLLARGHHIVIDQHFHGLTVVVSPPNGSPAAE
jgi:hypothetical protein